MANLPGYPQPAFHFTVYFGAASGVVDSSFLEVTGIGPEIQTEDLVEGGENRFVHRLPKTMKHPKLVLKRGMALSDSKLVTWCRGFFESDYTTSFKPTQLTVCLLNEAHAPIAAWSFANAYPIRWEVEPFNAMKNEIAIEKIELNYSYSVREK